MKSVERFLVRVAILAFGATAPACGCPSPQPVDVSLPPGNPPTTGAKVKCSCALTYSTNAEQDIPGLQAATQDVEACLPANFAGMENDFCVQRVEPFLQVAAEQVALSLPSPPGLPVICGGPYGDPPTTLPPLVTVACTAKPFNNQMLTFVEPSCVDQGANGVPLCNGAQGEVCCPIQCTTSGPGANCQIQFQNGVLALNQCNCTDPVATGPNGIGSCSSLVRRICG